VSITYCSQAQGPPVQFTRLLWSWAWGNVYKGDQEQLPNYLSRLWVSLCAVSQAVGCWRLSNPKFVF